MKPDKYIIFLLLLCCTVQNKKATAQDEAPKPIVKLHYFNNNNSVQYLLLTSALKLKKVLTPQKNKSYELFLDSSTSSNHIATMLTDENGQAKAIIPPNLKTAWEASPAHTFILKEGKEEIINDYTISKARISLDTLTIDSIRNIRASVMKKENDQWVPVADVEIKIGIERLGGILPAADEETYTTDSTGTVTVELKKDSIPGDVKGNYILAAKVQDNELLGNLFIEKTVAWGRITKPDTGFFNQRTLWTTRFKTPYWLLFIVYAIVIGVWGTIFYLGWQIFKIKKLGRMKDDL